VTVVGGRATLELRDGQKHQATLPTPDDVFQKAVADYNIANPTRPVTIEYTQESSPFTVIGSIFLSVLPILLLGAFFLYLTSRLRAR